MNMKQNGSKGIILLSKNCNRMWVKIPPTKYHILEASNRQMTQCRITHRYYVETHFDFYVLQQNMILIRLRICEPSNTLSQPQSCFSCNLKQKALSHSSYLLFGMPVIQQIQLLLQLLFFCPAIHDANRSSMRTQQNNSCQHKCTNFLRPTLIQLTGKIESKT